MRMIGNLDTMTPCHTDTFEALPELDKANGLCYKENQNQGR